MDDFLSIPALRGPLASLVPLSDRHAEDLAAAAGQKGMQSLWYTRIPAAEPAAVAEEIALRLQWQMALEREEEDAMALEQILRHLA